MDLLGGQAVVDAGPFPSGGHQAGLGQGPEVERGVGHGLADLIRQLLDVTFTLGQHVDQLSPTPVGQCLGHVSKPVEQGVLARSISHYTSPTLTQRTA